MDSKKSLTSFLFVFLGDLSPLRPFTNKAVNVFLVSGPTARQFGNREPFVYQNIKPGFANPKERANRLTAHKGFRLWHDNHPFLD